MKHLRQYIRQILLEVDLGDKVWADRAEAGQISHHWGDEPDTEIEKKLWHTLGDYMGGSVGFSDSEVLSAIKAAAQDPKYQDIFITRDSPFWRDRGLSRGQSLPKDHVEQLLKIKIPSTYEEAEKLPGWHHPWLTIDLSSPYLYKPEDFFRHNTEVSSWTQREGIAQNFALEGAGYRTGDIPVVFHAVPGEGEFLDLRQMYYYQGMEDYRDEEEYLALDDVPVYAIEIYYEEPDRGSW